jgi:hypothetical protein
MKSGNQIWGLAGSLFVSACCLGAAPIVVATATALGVGSLKSVFDVYTLGALMVASVGWVVWNMKIQAEALGLPPTAYAPFGLTLGGGIAAFICSFWLVDALLFTGRPDEARDLFERLLTKGNELD